MKIKMSLIVLILLFAFSTVGMAKTAEQFKEPVSVDKTFILYFSKEMDKETLNGKNIYVVDENGVEQSIYVSTTDSYLLAIVSPDTTWKLGKYTLHITTGVKSLSGVNMASEVTFPFTVKP